MTDTKNNDLEDVMSHLGDFGKYQRRQYFLHTVASFTSGIHMLSIVVTAAVPFHQCQIPSSQIYTSYPENSTILPRPIDNCHYLDVDNETRSCDAWTYDETYYQSSRGMDWNFVCSRRWMGAVAQSAYMLGLFAGAVILGSLSDKYGRKTVFYASSVLQLIFGVSLAFVPEYYTFLVFRFFYAMFGSAGAYITGFVLTMELVGASKRTICGLMFQVFFGIGYMLVGVEAALIKDRMWLQVIFGMHSLLLLGHWWLMDESPRWLWGQGRIQEALTIIQKALYTNGSSVRLDFEKYTKKSDVTGREKESSLGITDLLKTPNLRKRTLNICFGWFANAIAYYGLLLNSGSFVGNPFVMICLAGFIDIPSYVIMCFIVDRTGRRSVISTCMLIGGICCMVVPFVPKDIPIGPTISIAIVLVGKGFIAGSFSLIFNYTSELFPTVLRNTVLGLAMTCARLSATLTPMFILLDSFDPKVPSTLFGFVALFGGFFVLFLPETANQSIPETLVDGENFGEGDNCFASCFSRRKQSVQLQNDSSQKS